jgi:phage tail P2-like protein
LKESKLPSLLKIFSVLPDNASPLERALELTFSEELYSLESPYPNLHDAATTPNSALTLLALEKQVSIWDADDTEDIKRKQTANAWLVKQQSGKRQGIQTALNDLGFGCDVIPWYKSGSDEPYSMQINAYCLEQPLTPDINKRLDEVIVETKSERDIYTLRLMREVINNNYIGVSMECGITITSEPYYPTEHTSEPAIKYIGACVHTREIATSEPAVQ